jgi:hypothetical protein
MLSSEQILGIQLRLQCQPLKEQELKLNHFLEQSRLYLGSSHQPKHHYLPYIQNHHEHSFMKVSVAVYDVYCDCVQA